MQINEIFSSIDGEGIRTGYLVTFIRTFACNLLCSYCFGPNKNGKYPRVTLVDGTYKPLNEIVEGDIILTMKDGNIQETTVREIHRHKTDKYHNLVFPEKVICCTPEHPFYCNGDWKAAKDLVSGDICYKAKKQDYALYKVYGRKYKEELIAYSKQVLDLLVKYGATNFGERNGNYNPNIGHNYARLRYAINKGLCVNILTGESDKLVVHHLDGNKENDDINNLVIIPSYLHNQLHGRGFSFGKGNRANDFPLIHNSKNYGEHANKIMGYKEREFINLTCEPYNTFLVEDILVHNCDTLYAVKPETEEDKAKAFTVMTIEEIMKKVEELGNKRITFTGGEPLIQKDAKELVSELTLNDYEVNIETNGAVDLTEYRNFDIKNPIKLNKLILTMDWKSPSSGMRDKMIESNLELLQEKDVLKFVVGSKEDLDDMKNIISKPLKCHIFVSPVFGNIEPKEIVEYMKENNLQDIRMQLQLHKIIYPVDMRGV